MSDATSGSRCESVAKSAGESAKESSENRAASGVNATKSPQRVVSREEARPESDYMEADPVPFNVSPVKSIKDSNSSQSSPAKSSSSSKLVTDDFSYMDFDPASEKDSKSSERKDDKPDIGEVCSPHKVKSFIAHSTSTDDSNKDDEIFVDKDTNYVHVALSSPGHARKESDVDSGLTFTCAAPSQRKSSVEQRPGRVEFFRSVSQQNTPVEAVLDLGEVADSCGDVRGVKDSKPCQASGPSGRKSSSDSTGFHRFSSQSSNDSCSSVRKLSQDSSHSFVGLMRKPSQSSQESVGSVKHYSLDRSRQVIVKSATKSEDVPVQDEGYCDIDYEKGGADKVVGVIGQAVASQATAGAVVSSQPLGKTHHRSGSSSSLSSDRSSGRRVIDSLTSEEEMPTPEPMRSYIADDCSNQPVPETQFSFLSDELGDGAARLGGQDVGSPVKPPLSGRRSSPGTLKDITLESPRSGPNTRNLGNGSQACAGLVSRQTSSPSGSCKSPRTSGEIRTRNPSGPAVVSFKQPTNGNGGKFAGQSSLEPISTVQELQKQKSMPCMNLPVTTEKVTFSSEKVMEPAHQNRHSFSDLTQCSRSEYEEMTLGQADHKKCSSQQQLSDAANNSNELHYAELELKNSLETVYDKSPRVKSRHTSSNDDLSQERVSYAEIDYKKTETMKQGSDKDVKFTL